MKANQLQQRVPELSVDLSVEGKQHGFLTLPQRSTDSRHGSMQVPVCVVRRDEGPTIALLAGARGDEYEGQIALQHLANTLQVDDVSGCVIIVPTMNKAASDVGQALTPSDQRDLGQSFPGNVAGSVTEQLAFAITTLILEHVDRVIEFQSGGNSTQYASLAAVHFNTDNRALQTTCEESMIAFGADYSARLLPASSDTLAYAIQEQNKPYIAVRLGGGGSCHASGVESALVGMKNVLVQLQMLNHDLVLRATRMLEVTSGKNYVYAPNEGLLQMCKEPGEEVYLGSPIAKIVNPSDTGSLPVVIKADRNGILMARHHNGRIAHGNCLAIVADEVQR